MGLMRLRVKVSAFSLFQGRCVSSTPWGHAYEKEDELRRSGTNSTSAGALALGVSAAPLGLKIC